MKTKISIIINIILILFLCIIFPVQNEAQNGKIELVKVIDGDTIAAKIDDNIFKIRIFDIDCFEKSVGEHAQRQAKSFNKTQEEIVEGGLRAGEILERELKNKKLTFDFRGIDKYHRALGYIYADGQNISEIMLNSGYCFKYHKKIKI